MIPKRDAYVKIREMIFENEIAPGSHLVERRLAEKLEMSRVPVREALQRLVLEGFLVYLPGKGLVTRTYDERELLDLYNYREPLEGMAARLFCQRADEAEIQLLEQLLQGIERQVTEGNILALHRNDFAFHQAIAKGTRNTRLITELDEIYQECLYVTKTNFARKATELAAEQLQAMRSDLLAEHRAIYAASAIRDGDAAELAARASVRNGLTRFIRQITADKIESLEY